MASDKKAKKEKEIAIEFENHSRVTKEKWMFLVYLLSRCLNTHNHLVYLWLLLLIRIKRESFTTNITFIFDGHSSSLIVKTDVSNFPSYSIIVRYFKVYPQGCTDDGSTFRMLERC
ncbi:hypothetical protein KUTeg_020197 [Tegillarca granosa]|uniref:Uncharacterized protein n=1 Tax=Tegillarca granosa TaxID=220873 RepID=A0ABQ9ECI2_TEGGR|nr:hypothetical protein KUTeg_020197 [Tegillarca granosa]